MSFTLTGAGAKRRGKLVNMRIIFTKVLRSAGIGKHLVKASPV